MPENPGNQNESRYRSSPVIYERRRRKDILTRAIPVIGAVSLVLIICFILFLSEATPEGENFFTRILNITPSNQLDWFFVQLAFVIISINLVLCITGLVFNLLRHKRKTDRFNKPVIISLVCSLIGMTVFLVLFGIPF